MTPARLPNDDEPRFPRFRRPIDRDKHTDAPPEPLNPEREPGRPGPASDPRPSKEDAK